MFENLFGALGIGNSGFTRKEIIKLSDGKSLVIERLNNGVSQALNHGDEGRIVSSMYYLGNMPYPASSVNLEHEIRFKEIHQKYYGRCAPVVVGLALPFIGITILSEVPELAFIPATLGIIGAVCYGVSKKTEKEIETLKRQRRQRDEVREWRHDHQLNDTTAQLRQSYHAETTAQELARRSASRLAERQQSLVSNGFIGRHTRPVRPQGMNDEAFINYINERLDHEIRENEVEITESIAKQAREEADRKRIHNRWEDLDIVTPNDIKEDKS